MTTTWKIYNLERNISDGVVLKVIYGCIAQSDNFSSRTVSEIALTGDPTDPNFVPFNDLTEDIVIGWVKAELGTEEVTAKETLVQNQVQDQIDAEAAKTTEEGVPWT